MDYHSTLFTPMIFHYTRFREQFPDVPVFRSIAGSPLLTQLQTNSGLAVAEEQALIRNDGVVPGFVVEHRQS